MFFGSKYHKNYGFCLLLRNNKENLEFPEEVPCGLSACILWNIASELPPLVPPLITPVFQYLWFLRWFSTSDLDTGPSIKAQGGITID